MIDEAKVGHFERALGELIGFVSILTPQIKSAASQLMIVFTMVEEIATGRMRYGLDSQTL